jgi:chromosome segregation protein
VRLTQIKLAGFKSFVDPTHVKVPGDLVGVVGPNGCGKSNIIDAVRWVLGESRASALRGDSMQDVIFNGSTLRKPVARASVELIFDNSLGKAAGQWSQYAEISVKRVLTREGESSYHINNTHVRRRDIHDIFMGTGLGPRAYAIIEQGMISRIIEAKPEELRVFLEEAAGISKYKDRRRETENRLSDTRENLSRVGDIRQELGSQIEKLERQAEVARRFNDLSSERQHKQTLLWVLRRQEAEAEEERHHRDVERLTNELEAETARLREIEKDLELARQAHYAAGDALSAAQGELYNANSEVARLETEIRFVAETRQRLEAQIGQLRMQLENGARQRTELSEAASLWQSRAGETAERSEMARQQLEAEQSRLPACEQGLRDSRSRLDSEREAVVQSERSLQLEQTNVAHADRILEDLSTRIQRLHAERGQLIEPDQAALQQLLEELDDVAAQMSAQRVQEEETTELRSQVHASRQTMAGQLRDLEREHSSIAGRLDALERIQAQVDENSQIHDWIARWQLGSEPRLWQRLRVDEGWDTAVESILRDRLHAVEIGDPALLQNLLDNPPPAKLTALTPFSFGESGIHSGEPGLYTLSGLVKVFYTAMVYFVF